MALILSLKKTRVVLFTLTTVTSIIAGAADVIAIKKFTRKFPASIHSWPNLCPRFDSQRSSSKHSVPVGITITVATPEIEDTIIVLFVLTNLLSMQIGNFLLILLKDWFRPHWPPRMTHPRDGVAISTRTLCWQSWYLAGNTCAVLVVLIPATIFAARSMADVRISMEGMQFPAVHAGELEASPSFSGTYWNDFPTRFAIVSNWINLLVALFAGMASFIALSRRKTESTTMAPRSGNMPGSLPAEEKTRNGELTEAASP